MPRICFVFLIKSVFLAEKLQSPDGSQMPDVPLWKNNCSQNQHFKPIMRLSSVFKSSLCIKQHVTEHIF